MKKPAVRWCGRIRGLQSGPNFLTYGAARPRRRHDMALIDAHFSAHLRRYFGFLRD